jgi:rhamnose utilization protein RhaD (predicted bifunctional aldolase and dehydrogenase)
VAENATYLPVPSACLKKTNYTAWEKDLVDYLFRNAKLPLYRNLHLKKISQPGESERDFIVRLQQESREARDEAIEKLRDTYSKKIATLEERIRKAEQAVQREKDQARDAGIQTAVSLGSTLLSAFLGRKKVSTSSVGKAVTAARSMSRQAKQKGDVTRSKETVETYREQLAELEKALQADIDKISDKLDAKSEDVTAYEVKPLKRDCVVKALSLTWEPLRRESDGSLTKAW